MSVDTRTHRSGFDDQPALSMIKVDSDPAQVIVNHASFRVQLAQKPRPARALADTARIPVVRAGAPARRRPPVVWSGRSAPGDTGATGLLRAVRNSTATAERAAHGGDPRDAGATQVIPRVDLADDTAATTLTPVVDRPLLPPMRQAVGAYDTYETQETRATRTARAPRTGGDRPRDTYGDGGAEDDGRDESAELAEYDIELDDELAEDGRSQRPGEAVRHAYYPGRRMNLGVVLLPLRVFLGLISVYAGMGKLSDPVYFDGGERGSMVKWLNSLHPWALAEPLRDFALSHPVGAGLTVAFLQVVVGVLTVLGLWQRVAAVVGALLSAALIVTVSWKTVPAYDAPDIIYLAAWSPLIIAGAPVYSVDGRLASEAWRKLGPRSELWELRQRVLRRGAVVAAVVIGLTLLVGSMLGGAVRSTEVVTVPGPNQDPTNHLPGSALPHERPTGGSVPAGGPSGRTEGERRPTPSASSSGPAEGDRPTPPSSGQNAQRTRQETGGERPRETRGSGGDGQRSPDRSTPAQEAPSGSSGPSSGGGASESGSGGSDGSGGSSSGGGSGGGGSSGGGKVIGGLLG
ncbi:DoxX family membrane protein [Streptomyces sp. NPDC057638]|uniref:DoxX family protein n=1 Tax=Streptomyces sp. NPDC057638 TaxID=3346190 RepID=UPI0036A8130C